MHSSSFSYFLQIWSRRLLVAVKSPKLNGLHTRKLQIVIFFRSAGILISFLVLILSVTYSHRNEFGLLRAYSPKRPHPTLPSREARHCPQTPFSSQKCQKCFRCSKTSERRYNLACRSSRVSFLTTFMSRKSDSPGSAKI